MTQKVWFTIKESADYLATSTRSIYRFLNHPLEPLHYANLGDRHMRIHKSDLDAWLWYRKPYHLLKRSQKDAIKERNSYE